MTVAEHLSTMVRIVVCVCEREGGERGGGGGAQKKEIQVRKYHKRSVRSEDTCPLHVMTETDEDKKTY
jgi:hypothetical protein